MSRIGLFALIVLAVAPSYCNPPNPPPSPGPTSPPVPSTTPAPSPRACAEPTYGAGLGKRTPTLAGEYDAAIARVRAAHPEFFEGEYIAGWPASDQDPEGERKATVFRRWLAEDLVGRGRCAYLGGDDVCLLLGDHVECYRPCNYRTGRVWDAANMYKGDTEVLGPAPGTPAPTVAPPGTIPPADPTPRPSPGACRLPAEPGRLRFGIGIRRDASVYLDASPQYYYEGIGDVAFGPCGRRWCDLGVDGGDDGRQCTDPLVGTPTWSTVSGALELVPGFKGNPYFAKVAGGTGRARVCSSVMPASCGEINVP